MIPTEAWTLDAQGWLHGAQRLPSPFQDARAAGMQPELLVIHNISLPAGEFGGPHIAALFLGQLDSAAHASFASLQGLQVSAHFLITRKGQIQQFVGCQARAWHAGVSSWQGRAQCNHFSIGIELEGCDWLPFEEAQYRSLQQLSCALLAHYPQLRAIAGHQHIAPGRKTDPGPCFDWPRYRDSLQSAGWDRLRWSDQTG
ncbi:1,6-anhydro-N-acetylmuramyl-L-alanine amidase AmpD [Massilia sp. W12]|uniref:1,6-anhydro-N-acetylmuramyl-L-alanine amidase AmpD n=1 Tax=Massilia sp. W12 TaxID=3126507 RepID=UPI0030D270E0